MSTTFTVKQFSELKQISEHKVLALIACGALRASNYCVGSQRKRWRITLEAIEDFERARSNQRDPQPQRRRRKKEASEISFY